MGTRREVMDYVELIVVLESFWIVVFVFVICFVSMPIGECFLLGNFES